MPYSPSCDVHFHVQVACIFTAPFWKSSIYGGNVRERALSPRANRPSCPEQQQPFSETVISPPPVGKKPRRISISCSQGAIEIFWSQQNAERTNFIKIIWCRSSWGSCRWSFFCKRTGQENTLNTFYALIARMRMARNNNKNKKPWSEAHFCTALHHHCIASQILGG